MVNKLAVFGRLRVENDGPLPSIRAPVRVNRAPAPVPVTNFQRLQQPARRDLRPADWTLEDFLRGAGIAIIPIERVNRIMDEAAQARGTWSWYPYREDDRGLTGWKHARCIGSNDDGSGIWCGELADELYPLPAFVPEKALDLATIVMGEFPGVHILVAHYDARRPDPFLALTLQGEMLCVIAEWRRPGRHEPLLRQAWRRLYVLAAAAGLCIGLGLLTWKHSGDHPRMAVSAQTSTIGGR